LPRQFSEEDDIVLHAILSRTPRQYFCNEALSKKERIMEIFGIDIAGTGIKGAPVETTSGELLAERFRLLTPRPATSEAVKVAELTAPYN